MKGKYLWRISMVLILSLGIMTMPRPVSAKNLADDGKCPSTPTRLKQGDIAVVSDEAGKSGLNLRVQPGTSENIIMSIPLYAYVTTIAGPRCNEGYRWFEVGYQGQDGWSAEVGPKGQYNLKPNPPSTNQSSNGGNSETNSQNSPDTVCDTNGARCWPALHITPSSDDACNFNQFVRVDNLVMFIQCGNSIEYLGIEYAPTESAVLNNEQTLQVPDVDYDPAGYCAFRNKYFANIPNPKGSPCEYQAVNNQPITEPQTATDVPTEQVDQNQLQDGYDLGTKKGILDVQAANAQDLFTPGQCTWFVAGKRDDVQFWIGGRPRHAYLWAERALSSEAKKLGIKVTKTPEAGSIAVWGPACDSASQYGHVAYVTSYNSATNKFFIEEINWSVPRPEEGIPVTSCMTFISLPHQSGAEQTGQESPSQNAPSIWEIIWNAIINIFS